MVKTALQQTEGACTDGRLTLKWISGDRKSGNRVICFRTRTDAS